MLLKFVTVLVLGIAGLAALHPHDVSWAFVGAVALFELWLLWRMRSLERGPVQVDEPPYHFSAEEAKVVERYRFYFAFPALAANAASVLAAVGLASLVLALWLTYRQAFVQGVLIGLNLVAVSWFTRRVAPVPALRIAGSRGKRDALRTLELFDPVWTKIRAGNAAVR